MNKKEKFDIYKLRGKLSTIRDWMNKHHFPPKLLFFLMGIISTIWFLIRVIPKPSRVGYPCMQVAAPFMSGFIVYIISLGGITLALRKARQNILRARYVAAGSFVLIALTVLVISLSHGTLDSYADGPTKTGPDDGPNQPIGKALGVFPGRVIWAWDKNATNENCTNSFDNKDWYFKPENTNQKAVGRMLNESVKKLGGKTTISESWDALFRYHNNKKHRGNKGYSPGEKIFIKINQTTSRGVLSQEDKDNGYYYPAVLKLAESWKGTGLGTVETTPSVVLELLRQLVNEVGIDQSNIAIGDPQNPIYGHNYDAWFAEFPRVVYIDKVSTIHGRTLIHETSNDLVYYSDKTQNDKLFDVIENADYLINVANLKPHAIAGISLTAKNHFGSQSRKSANHLHYSLMAPYVKGKPTNTGYHKYRVLVDLMGSKYLGQNTVLYVVDGLYGGGASELLGPVKYFMPPFCNDWSSSIFISQDQVALESVCYDFLRTEWNGVNNHDASNNAYNIMPNANGVDDYLHQAADSSNWPEGILYDPDNSGRPLSSLGAHEHWNNAVKKQYSRNLGYNKGIELVSIPDTLVRNEGSAGKSNIINHASDQGIPARTFYSAIVDKDNIKWFLTENGVVSFDGKKWMLRNNNRKISTKNLRGFAYAVSEYGSEIYIATSEGATVASLPIDARSGATTYHTGNTPILSNNVIAVNIGKNPLRWFGTDKGISAFYDHKWLAYSYQKQYPEGLFKDFPITALGASPSGDTLYVGTKGAGVARVFRNDVDAISGASEYAQWGPIQMPSDNICSLYISPDGTQWIGTDQGVARHIGYNTLEKWTVFTVKDGLVNNFVQTIAMDKKGKIWFGTKGGVSVFDGSSWTNFKEGDGLTSDNILCIAVDQEGIVWLGTDNGVISYSKGKFIRYK